MRKSILGITALAVLLSTVAVGVSVASDRANTSLSLKSVELIGGGEAHYKGKVGSKKAKCKKGRKIKLFHDSDPPFLIGETVTDENGNWEIIGPYPHSPNDDNLLVKVKGNEKCKGNRKTYNFYEFEGVPQ